MRMRDRCSLLSSNHIDKAVLGRVHQCRVVNLGQFAWGVGREEIDEEKEISFPGYSLPSTHH